MSGSSLSDKACVALEPYATTHTFFVNAGAPLQFKYIDAQVQPQYARYPGIDYASVFDFPKCPTTFNFTNNRLTVSSGPFCWVTGSFTVRP